MKHKQEQNKIKTIYLHLVKEFSWRRKIENGTSEAYAKNRFYLIIDLA